MRVTTFITRLESADGLRLAVKDNLDVAGVVTTFGCAAVADEGRPAEHDAPCVATARAAGAAIVGKTNMHELGLGATGINPWYGTPVNPLDPSLVPGGSSSGSTVAVATGEADVAYGTDAGGSCRIPPACCGVAGLKTTLGRIPVGDTPLAMPTLDVIGPIAPNVAGLVDGMRLMEPGFEPASAPARVVGRVRLAADAEVDAAVDRALATAGFEVVPVTLPGWEDAYRAGSIILIAEAYETIGHLLTRRDRLSDQSALLLEFGRAVPASDVEEAHRTRDRWIAELDEVFTRCDVIALPTIPRVPPALDAEPAAAAVELSSLTMPLNLAGVPALAMPVPAGKLPASLQLFGPDHSEELLLATAMLVETAIA